MDQLPGLGTEISQIVRPTHEIYAPLLLRQATKIRSTDRNTYAYGAHPRQKLDLYTPSAGARPVTTNPNSILVFLYGGGLVRGDKINDAYLDGLVYANLGHYFAENLGFETAVVDYRLLSHGAAFPSGAEDLCLAIDWLLRRSAAHSPKPLDIYLMGNSAGGVHLSTYLLAPDFAESRRQISGTSDTGMLKAAILISVPFHFERADPSRSDHLTTYFGQNINDRCPLGLLKAAKDDTTINELRQVPILVLKGSLDPEDEILVPIADFVHEWQASASVASNLTVQMMEGHNHISPVLAVGTAVPSEESWARQATDFIVASSQK